MAIGGMYHREVAIFLIVNGADPTIETSHGDSAIKTAVRYQYHSLVAFMKKWKQDQDLRKMMAISISQHHGFQDLASSIIEFI